MYALVRYEVHLFSTLQQTTNLHARKAYPGLPPFLKLARWIKRFRHLFKLTTVKDIPLNARTPVFPSLESRTV